MSCPCGKKLIFKFQDIGLCAICQGKFKGTYKMDLLRMKKERDPNYKNTKNTEYHREYYHKNKDRILQNRRNRSSQIMEDNLVELRREVD